MVILNSRTYIIHTLTECSTIKVSRISGVCVCLYIYIMKAVLWVWSSNCYMCFCLFKKKKIIKTPFHFFKYCVNCERVVRSISKFVISLGTPIIERQWMFNHVETAYTSNEACWPNGKDASFVMHCLSHYVCQASKKNYKCTSYFLLSHTLTVNHLMLTRTSSKAEKLSEERLANGVIHYRFQIENLFLPPERLRGVL